LFFTFGIAILLAVQVLFENSFVGCKKDVAIYFVARIAVRPIFDDKRMLDFEIEDI
jgi:hypothetical protein